MTTETGERIHDYKAASAKGHIARYMLASAFVEHGDTVVDAACGIGYGADILDRDLDIHYVGVDKDTSECPDYSKTVNVDRKFIEADLEAWVPDFTFDVVVSLETIEHVGDYRRYIDWMCEAHKWIVISCPVVPTVGINPYHKHDFSPGELPSFFDGWELFQAFQQPMELSEIYILGRPGAVLV